MNRNIIILVLSGLLIAAVSSGCVQERSGIETPSPTPQVTLPSPTPTSEFPSPSQTPTSEITPPSVPSTGMEVNLSISNAPALNETAELICTITSISDAYNTTAQIELPEGLVLVSGNLSWNGDIIVPEEEKRKHPRPPLGSPAWEKYEYPKGKTEFGVLIKSVEVGNWTITATAGYDVFTQEGTLYGRLGDSDYVYLAVREDTAWISETVFTTEGPAPARQLNVTPPLPPVEATTENITTPEPVKPPSVPPTGMEVNLSSSNAPALNEIAELTCSITSVSDAHNTTAQIELPEGFELVGGNLYWNGNVIVPEEEKLKQSRPPLNGSGQEWEQLWEEYEYPKGRVEFSAVVKAVKVGNWTITATSGYDVFTQEGTRYGRLGDSDYVYLAVREETAWISETPFPSKRSEKCIQLNVTPTIPTLVNRYISENVTTPKPEMSESRLRVSPPDFIQATRQTVIPPRLPLLETLPHKNITMPKSEKTPPPSPEMEVNLSIANVSALNEIAKQDTTSQNIIASSAAFTIFEEDFEGAFPGDNWAVGDSNPDSGEDYWDDTSYRNYGGSWSGYCADIGDTGANHKYDNNMYASMIRKYVIDASDWDSATLSYYSWYEIESGYDYLRVIVTGDGGSHWYEIGGKFDGNSGGWEYHSLSIPPEYLTSQFGIGFLFYSDSSITYEGAYLDNIELEAEIPTGPLAITGRWWGNVSETAFTPGQPREDVTVPLVWGGVFVYDGNGNLLGYGITGAGSEAGKFNITVDNPGNAGFYVEIVPDTSACNVTDLSGDNHYSGYTSIFYPSPDDTTYDIGEWSVPEPSDYRSAWRIYETIVNDYYDRGAWDFLANEGSGYTPSKVTVRFPADGTYYSTMSHEIHIEFVSHTMALDVVQHEYGHFVMHMVYNLYWPITHCPSPHYINRFSHPNCAWTEGWANFFPISVQVEPNFEWGDGNYIDLEEPTWGTPNWDDGEGVEGRVAGVLYDIYDSTNDGYDTFTDGFLNVWDVVYHQTDDNFAEFYTAWRDRGHDVPNANAAIFQNTIDYNNPPSCTIISPNGGGWYSGTITVSASASDDTGGYIDGTVSQVEFEYYDWTWHHIGTDTSPSGGWSVDWDTGTLTDSTVWVRAKARDNLGEESEWDESDDSFGVDNTDPGGWQDFNLPDWTNDRTPDCMVEVEDDDSGLDVSTAYYKYSTDGGSTWSGWISASCTGSDYTTDYETITASSVPFNQDSETQNTIKFKITDMAGNTGYSSVYTVKIDATSPSASISINNGTAYTNSTSVTLSLSYSDTVSGVNGCRYKNEGDSWTGWESCVSTKPWELTAGNGEKTVYYQVRDYADNIKEVSDSIVLDTTPPVITIHSPLNQTYDTTSLVLNVTTDEIADVWYDLNGQGNVSLYNDSTHGNTNITVQEGANEIVVYAVDRAENVNSTVRYFDVEVVNEPPNASFTYLPKGATEEIAIESVGDICVGYMVADVIQTFKAVGDTITGIDLDTIWGGFEIWITIENLNGTILGTSEHASSQEGWTHLEFSSPVVVTPGETYKILGGGSNEGVWISCSNPYPDVGLIYPYPPLGGKDMLFKLYSYAYLVEFIDNSTDSDGTITVWYWDFDDGKNSTEQHPLHNYTALGIYTITFNVTDNDGATDSTSENISVNPPIASFMYRPILPTTADLIVFNASASYGGNGTITNYEWDWTSDGTIDDTGIIATYQYTTAGTYTVTLTVTNNHGATDNASRNITVTIPLGEAVDNTELSWSTGGDSEYGNWFGQLTIYYYDGDAAQSGRIGNNQASWIQTNVTGPGNLTFYWKVSSEADYDFLRFYIDDVEQANISGEVDWHQMSFNISAGNHTLKWLYEKDEYVKAGSDCGWLDKVGYQILPMEGDVNGDRHVTSVDSQLVQNYLADPAAHPLNDSQLTSANTYEIAPDPTTINIYDVMYIQKWLSDPGTPLWDEEHDLGVTVPPQP